MLSFCFTIIGLIVGAFLGNWFKTIQLRLDHELARHDDMVKEVLALQTLIQDYWVSPRLPEENSEKFDRLAAEILGRFSLLNSFYSSVRNWLTKHQAIDLQKAIDDFWENATGGDFGDNVRDKDLKRVQRVYRTGGALIKTLRDMVAERLISPPEKFGAWIANGWARVKYWFT